MSGCGRMHVNPQFVGGAGGIRNPLRYVNVDGSLVYRRGRRHPVIVSGRRFDARVFVDVHRQRGGVEDTGFVFHRVRDVVRSVLLRSGERDQIVVNMHAVDALRFHIRLNRKLRVVSGNIVLRDRHGSRNVRSQRDLIVACVHAGIETRQEHADPDLRLRALPGPILDGIREDVGAGGVHIRLVHQIRGADLNYTAQLRCRIAQPQQLHVIAIAVDAGQGNRDPYLASCGHLRFHIRWRRHALVVGVPAVHGKRDRSGRAVAEIVHDGIRHGESSGLAGCLVAHGIAGNEHQSGERAFVIAQIITQPYRGAVRIRDMVKHINRDDTAGTHRQLDIVGFRRGVLGGQGRRLQHDDSGRCSGRIRHAIGDPHRSGRYPAGGDVHAFVAHHAGFDTAGCIGLH